MVKLHVMDRPEDAQTYRLGSVDIYRPEDMQVYSVPEPEQNTLITFLSSLLSFFGARESEKRTKLSSSDEFDHQYDWRQPSIEKLTAEAKAAGKDLPDSFVRNLYNCSSPYWIDGDIRIPIFNSDGSINPDAHTKIMASAADGSLEQEARLKDAHYLSQMARLEGSRENILETVERRTGLELNGAIRQELEKTGAFGFTDSQGRHREINLNGTHETLIAGEIRELTALHGGPRDVDFSDVAASQARGVQNILNKDRCRS